MNSIVEGGKDGGSTSDRFWEEARDIFYQDLDQAKRAKLDDTTRLEDTIQSLKLTQSKVSNEYRTHTLRVGSKDIDIKVGRIMRRLELMLQVGDAAMQFGPETVSLVWSAFRMVFTGFLKDSQLCASLFDAVDQISDILFVCQVYAKQYSKERVVMDDSKAAGDRVLKQIPPLYAIVLKFSYQTRRLVNDHGKVGRTLIGVIGGEFEELKKTVDDAKEKRNTLQGTADVAFKAAAIGILEGDSKVLGDVQEAINAVMMPDLKFIQVELIKNREHKEKEKLDKDCQEHKDWLLTGTSAELQAPERQHLANLRHRHPGTCKWILGTPSYETWRDQETPSLLRLFGEGGFGKSYLVSTIIEDLKDYIPRQTGSKSQLVYFFCRSGDNAMQYGVKIMLHLVAQLFTAGVAEADEGNDKLPNENVKYKNLIDVLKNARDKIKGSEGKRDSSLLQINSVFQPIFIDLAQVINTRLFVVVDGLDECSDLTDGFLGALKALPESDADIRVLVSSRPEDQIVNDLGHVPYKEIEVDKETNHADILAYIEESLKSMPRFRQLNIGPRIATKSDGMFKCRFSPTTISNALTNRSVDANMVIESLKQSKALRTNAHQLMKSFPDGMNDLYKQKLQRLEEYDREMLLVALRWLMCSEGRIETNLVADDIEQCYEDLEHDEDDSGNEDNEESDKLPMDIGISTGIRIQEEANEDRDSIKRLKAVGRDFLKFSSAVVDVQHKSVRDFIYSEEKSLPQDPRICPECIKRMNQDSIYQASPKHGHLIMVENIFRKLMSRSFQDEFIIIKGFEKGRIDAASATSSTKRPGSDTLLGDYLASGNVTPQHRPDFGIENQASKDTVSPVTETIELGMQSATEAEKINHTPDLPNSDSDDDDEDFNFDEEHPPRYELEQWPRHLRAAEEAWPAAERQADMQERWEKIYTTIEMFLSPESLVYKSWSRRLSLWQRKPCDPLHVAANFGLLGMIQRYTSYGTNLDVLDEDGWTPLHFACRNSDNVGIELLVQHKADINAATTDTKETPLLLLTRFNGSSKWFQYLLDHGASPEVSDSDGWTCLHNAAGNRNFELCSILLRCTTVDINAKDSEGDTPLHWMFKFPNASYELVKLFLDHGSKVNEQNHNSQGPLYAACLVGNVTGARLLLDYKADVDDDEDVFGITALHAAVEVGNLELVKLLVEREADVYRKDKRGRECFAQAADEDQVKILEYLLDKWRSLNSTTQHLLTQDLNGDTPLHRSAASGNEEAVILLLKASDAATIISQSNHNGATPLHIAAYTGRRQIVDVLLDNGASPLIRTNERKLPLDFAFEGWKDDYWNAESEETITQLAGVSPDISQSVGNLDFAIEKGAIEFVKLLENPTNGADIHGWTSIVLAEVCGQYEIARILLDNADTDPIEASEPAREPALVHSPSRWSTMDKHPQLILSEDGLEVACPTDSEDLYLRMIARTDHPVAAGLSKYYYEISVLEAAFDLPILGLGFSSKYASLNKMPGWPGNGAPSWGYHGDDGKKFANTGQGAEYSVGYGPGDVVGCGVNFTDGTIYYTKNGVLLPTAFENVRGRLFPVVGMGSLHGVRIRANFGQQKEMPFVYQP